MIAIAWSRSRRFYLPIKKQREMFVLEVGAMAIGLDRRDHSEVPELLPPPLPAVKARS